MKLKQYAKESDLTIQDIADGVKLPHETVRKHYHGISKPRDAKTVKKYMKFTNNAVSYGDFYNA